MTTDSKTLWATLDVRVRADGRLAYQRCRVTYAADGSWCRMDQVRWSDEESEGTDAPATD